MNINFNQIKKSLFFLSILIIIVLVFLISVNVGMIGFLFLSSFYLYLMINFLFAYYKYPHIEKKPKFPKKTPEIAIVTYAYNNFKPITDTIKHLKKLKYPKKYTIYIITDGTCNFLNKIKGVKQIVVDKKYFKKGRNIKAEIMNVGLKQIHEEYMLCLDGDTIVNTNALIEMVPFLENKDVAVVNTLLIPKNTNKFFEKLQMYEYHINWGLALRVLSSMNAISIPVGGLFLMRNSVFRELKGYDINNITEDRELGYRILEKGYLIRFTSRAKSYTMNPSNLSAWAKQRMRWARGELATIYKHKHFFFNSDVGFFGQFVLPFTFILQTLGIATAFGLVINFFSENFLFYFYYLFEILKTGISNLYFDFSVLIPDFLYMPSTIFLIIFSTILFIIYTINAFSLSDFKFRIRHIPSYIVFIIFYVFFVGSVYISAVFLEFINYKLPIFKRKT